MSEAAVQIGLTGALVLVTAVYAWRTHVISRAAKEQAEASLAMAEEMREQRYGAVRPIIDIQRGEYGEANVSAGLLATNGDLSRGLLCRLHNIGLGPATDVYSLIQDFRGGCRRFDFGTLAAKEKTNEMALSVTEEDDRMVLVVYYRDIHGRDFESRREVRICKAKPSVELGLLDAHLVKERL